LVAVADLPGGTVSNIGRRPSIAAGWDRVPGEGLWPWLNSALVPHFGPGELPVTDAAQPVPITPPGTSASDLADWYRARFARFPASPEQLAEWERLVCRHGRDPVEPLLCRVCRVLLPCLPRADAQAALSAARGDVAECDPDPLVRLSARVMAAQRAAEGFAALLLPLLADAQRVVAAHGPDTAGRCPACRDPSRVGDVQVVWPCGMYRLAATVLRQGRQPRLEPEQAGGFASTDICDSTGDEHGS
jgi:AcrR family transcriptional regulator